MIAATSLTRTIGTFVKLVTTRFAAAARKGARTVIALIVRAAWIAAPSAKGPAVGHAWRLAKRAMSNHAQNASTQVSATLVLKKAMKTMKTKMTKPLTLKRRSRKRENYLPALRFSPTAWAKLHYLREAGESEIGGFAITADDDPAYVEDVKLLRQRCTAVSVVFDDSAVADFFDEQVDQGLRPDRFARIWVHTHPGDCPLPSWVDEQTFRRVFERPDWAIMFILAGGQNSYARVRYNTGPGMAAVLPVQVDYSRPFPASDIAAWNCEYAANVTILPFEKAADPDARDGLAHQSIAPDSDTLWQDLHERLLDGSRKR